MRERRCNKDNDRVTIFKTFVIDLLKIAATFVTEHAMSRRRRHAAAGNFPASESNFLGDRA